jgi:hypothetical protein
MGCRPAVCSIATADLRISVTQVQSVNKRPTRHFILAELKYTLWIWLTDIIPIQNGVV